MFSVKSLKMVRNYLITFLIRTIAIYLINTEEAHIWIYSLIINYIFYINNFHTYCTKLLTRLDITLRKLKYCESTRSSLYKSVVFILKVNNFLDSLHP